MEEKLVLHLQYHGDISPGLLNDVRKPVWCTTKMLNQSTIQLILRNNWQWIHAALGKRHLSLNKKECSRLPLTANVHSYLHSSPLWSLWWLQVCSCNGRSVCTVCRDDHVCCCEPALSHEGIHDAVVVSLLVKTSRPSGVISAFIQTWHKSPARAQLTQRCTTSRVWHQCSCCQWMMDDPVPEAHFT